MKDQLQEFGKLLPEREALLQEKQMIALLLLLGMISFAKVIFAVLAFPH